LRKERAYWVNVFDSAPVREKEHPHDIVARNFARIEVDRLDKDLQSLEESLLDKE
jgi:hypothetical protein